MNGLQIENGPWAAELIQTASRLVTPVRFPRPRTAPLASRGGREITSRMCFGQGLGLLAADESTGTIGKRVPHHSSFFKHNKNQFPPGFVVFLYYTSFGPVSGCSLLRWGWKTWRLTGERCGTCCSRPRAWKNISVAWCDSSLRVDAPEWLYKTH